jgi:hypothetical protein
MNTAAKSLIEIAIGASDRSPPGPKEVLFYQ